MTSKERKAYQAWCAISEGYSDEMTRHFKAMQDLYDARGGGNPTCSLEANLEYLLTSSDKATRNRALALYAMYYEASGHYNAYMKLGQAMANAQN